MSHPPLWLGRLLFWLGWPALWLYLVRSRRTRVAVWNNGRLLVVKTWMGDGSWSLPGGGMHASEPSNKAAVRELHEETGILLSPDQLRSSRTLYYRRSGLRFSYELFTATLVGVAPGVERQPLEISQAEWLTPAELQNQICGPDVIEALRS